MSGLLPGADIARPPRHVRLVPQPDSCSAAKIMLPDCGHWTQQEKPDNFNSAQLHFLTFLNGLGLQ
jgi:pimeloyl-ACP methyl ester carboxylesterase